MEKKLQDRVRDAMLRTLPLWPAFFKDALAVEGLSDLTMLQLGVLAAAQQKTRVDALVGLLGVNAGEVDQARAALERRGLVTASGGNLALSPDGECLFDGMITARASSVAKLYDTLPAQERDSLVEYIERFAKGVGRIRVPEEV